MKRTHFIIRILYYLICSILSLIFIFPFLVMFFGSLDTEEKYIITLTSWIPTQITFDNYIHIFSVGSSMTRWFINSCIISLIPTATGVVICSLLGYIFAKKQFKGKNIVFWFFMLAIMVPYQATIISNYLVYNFLGWLNTYTVFLIPGLWTVMYMFMMRQFIADIPNALLEAAKIDGAGEWMIYFRVVLPLCTPALSTVAIFTFMDKWNDFMGPLIFTSTESMYNLIVGLSTLLQKTASFSTQMTSGVVTFIPMFVVFLALQKYFVDGIVTSGVKG